jgi:hypothetical protein
VYRFEIAGSVDDAHARVCSRHVSDEVVGHQRAERGDVA